MGKTRKKTIFKEKQHKTSLLAKLHLFWVQKRPVIFFVLGFIVLMVLFYAFWISYLYQKQTQPQLLSAYTRLSSFILNIFGFETHARGAIIGSSRFTMSVARGCDGIEVMAIFGSTLLVFPARWKYKLIGFFVGIAMLFILNFIRIISLFITGIYSPKVFEFMHVEVWQALFIIFAIGIWVFWIKWTRKGEAHVS